MLRDSCWGNSAIVPVCVPVPHFEDDEDDLQLKKVSGTFSFRRCHNLGHCEGAEATEAIPRHRGCRSRGSMKPEAQ
jgi:hypothetical protein